MESVNGYVSRVIYRNEQNGYTVVEINVDDGQTTTTTKLTLVGYFVPPEKYELYRYHGNYIEHARFGMQFQVKSYERILPTDQEAVIRLLSSPKFPRIGKVKAEAIYLALGPNCLERIKQHPDTLEQVVLSEVEKQAIIDGLNEVDYLEQATQLFVQHGLTLRDLSRIAAVYGESMIDAVLSDPYGLIDYIDGIDFRAADRLALSLGFAPDAPERYRAAFKVAVQTSCQKSGNTYTNGMSINYYYQKLLGQNARDSFSTTFDYAAEAGVIYVSNEKIYPINLYMAELAISDRVIWFLQQDYAEDREQLYTLLAELEARETLTYSSEQKEAIVAAFQKGINLVTGGPGTGKTTIIKAICALYQQSYPKDKVILCAPTGRAAKRLNELTGVKAMTIHRALGWDFHTNKFAFNACNPLPVDFIIIDEFSMVDTELFHHLLEATPSCQRLLVVGDEEQLPPVMPGDLFRTLLELRRLNYFRLQAIFRQSEDSDIIELAYAIRQQQLTSPFIGRDVTFYDEDESRGKARVLKLVKTHLDKGLSELDIQVIVAMYQGSLGITALNESLRQIFNPPTLDKVELRVNNRLFRVGDKVLQLKNQPNEDVYNGDIGMIREIIVSTGRESSVIVVEFDGNFVSYDAQTFHHLTLAYAISVHKAQGSEYPVVIFVHSRQHEVMMKKKLIYTACTRAKKHLYLVGPVDVLLTGVKTLERVRLTTLSERINDRLL